MATIKQKQAVKEIVENRGNVSKAMETVGYTKATAKNPSNLTNSKGFQKLLKELIDNNDLLNEVIDVAMSKDSRAKLQAIDMLFKLQDVYPDKKLRLGKVEEMLGNITE